MSFVNQIHAALDLAGPAPGVPGRRIEVFETGSGNLPSVFDVTGVAVATIGRAAAEVAALVADTAGTAPSVTVDRRLASMWFARSVDPIGWDLPPTWDPIAGDYPTADGWIRLHTNAPHHRAAARSVLRCEADREDVASAVAVWQGSDLEAAVVAAGGCAAVMRSVEAWRHHPQGIAVNAEPLVDRRSGGSATPWRWRPDPQRPLAGLRVLDMTRVLAGPVATRFLAGFGADVLRIDPPGWDEPAVAAEVTLGKRCARLDARTSDGRARLVRLLAEADLFVHGYRSDALDRLGLGVDRRRSINPALIDVALDAYGWTGAWSTRRGFDSLVQMSSGIADAGMRAAGADRPRPLPTQALDHATGYLMAAAAVRGVRERLANGTGSWARVSLARTARMVIDGPEGDLGSVAPTADDGDWAAEPERTAWGPMRRLLPPMHIAGAPVQWPHSARPLGTDRVSWALGDREGG